MATANGVPNEPAAAALPPSPSPSPSLYPLHECVFEGDVAKLSALIRHYKTRVSSQDPHGNSPLHLAVMLGRRELVHLLLAHGSTVKVKNKMGWSPLSEAIRYAFCHLFQYLHFVFI
jgi:ankyrin repeat protein